jgi:hypothetical protein
MAVRKYLQTNGTTLAYLEENVGAAPILLKMCRGSWVKAGMTVEEGDE